MLSVVIQAGGESRRMGQDKALLPFLGQPLIQRVLTRLAPLADESIITTNRPPDYAFLGLPCVPDLVPGRGALGGLYTALTAAQQPLVAVVACDMPFVSPELLAYQRDLLAAEDWDAVVPQTAGGTEPFHAIYRRETCLPKIKTVLEAGKWRVDAWFAEARIRFLSAAEVQPYDPHGLTFWNLNTPDEFRQAEQIASGRLGPDTQSLTP